MFKMTGAEMHLFFYSKDEGAGNNAQASSDMLDIFSRMTQENNTKFEQSKQGSADDLFKSLATRETESPRQQIVLENLFDDERMKAPERKPGEELDYSKIGEPLGVDLDSFFSKDNTTTIEIQETPATSVFSDMFTSSKTDEDESGGVELFTAGTNKELEDDKLQSVHSLTSTSLTETQLNSEEEMTEVNEFDLYTYLENVESQLENKKYGFNLINSLKITSPRREALKFLKRTLQDNLESFGSSLTIEDLVRPPVDDSSVVLLFEYMNLQENMKQIGARETNFLSTLQQQKERITKEVEKEKNVIIDLINRNKPELEEQLSSFYNQESNTLTKDERDLISLIEKAEQLAVASELDNNEELFEETEDIKEIVNDLKERIINVLGSKFIQNSKDTFEIPKDREELEQLLDNIAEIAENSEIKESSVYDKVGFKLLRMLYTPTRYTNGEFRVIISLLNTLAIAVVAVKFKTLVVGTFVMSAAYDLFTQVKLATKNDKVSLLADFVKNADNIIDSLKESITQEKIAETRELSKPSLARIRDYYDEVRESLLENYGTKLNEIDELEEGQDLIILINEHYQDLQETLDTKVKAIKEDYKASLTEFTAQLQGKIDSKEREIIKNPSVDIYEDANHGKTVYNPLYKIARIAIEGTDLGIDFKRNIDEGSYLIKCKGNVEREKIANFIKLLIMQQQTYLKPGHAILNVYDTEQVGALFMDLKSEEEELFNIYTREDKLQEKIEDLVYEITKRHSIALKNFNSLTEYNSATHVTGMKPFPYLINFWYNIPKEIASKSDFQTIIKEGKKAGLLNIYIMDETNFVDRKGEKEEDILYDYNTHFDYIVEKGRDGVWNLEHNKATRTVSGPIFHKIQLLETKPIVYDKSKVVEKAQNLDKFLADTKSELILYQELQEEYAKDLFTKDTLTGIDICVGFKDGDKKQPLFVRLDDELVHCLMAGKTGAGKSNTINVALLNLLRNYSPEWLELYMIDFKNVEFNFYTHEKDYGEFKKKLSLVPHASMIAGTTDPEYALSVFSQALREMERRKKVLAKGINGTTFKKIESYNKYILKNDLQGKIKIIPRVLILLDEFQVMFKMEDQDKLQRIKDMIERLSREARSMGMHMFFTSQSMDGTLKDDVKGQFAMRFCLSASADTSKSVLGNDASSKLKGKGWIYMSGTQERKEEDNKLIKVPLLEEDYNKQVLMEINEACVALNKEKPLIPSYEVEFYDESEKHNVIELARWLKHKDVRGNRSAILLGNKVVYRNYSNPENTIINNSDTENMLVTANDKEALANILNSLTANYSTKERTRVVVLNCDRNMDGMLKEEYINKDYVHMLTSNNILPFIESINGDVIGPANDEEQDSDTPREKTAAEKMAEIFNGPAEIDDDDYVPERYNPDEHTRWVIVIVGIHKAEGFNEDYVDDKYMAPLMHMLKYGPLQGVTTILNYKTPFKARKILPQISHRISAKVDDDISYELFNGRSATQLFSEDGLSFAMYMNAINGETFKFKVFEFEYDKSLLSAKKITGLSLVV